MALEGIRSPLLISTSGVIDRNCTVLICLKQSSTRIERESQHQRCLGSELPYVNLDCLKTTHQAVQASSPLPNLSSAIRPSIRMKCRFRRLLGKALSRRIFDKRCKQRSATMLVSHHVRFKATQVDKCMHVMPTSHMYMYSMLH
jgi:hypothetical protein